MTMKTHMPPHVQARHRDNTNRTAHQYNWGTQTCPGCKRSRSKGQFEGFEKCRTCRGLK